MTTGAGREGRGQWLKAGWQSGCSQSVGQGVGDPGALGVSRQELKPAAGRLGPGRGGHLCLPVSRAVSQNAGRDAGTDGAGSRTRATQSSPLALASGRERRPHDPGVGCPPVIAGRGRLSSPAARGPSHHTEELEPTPPSNARYTGHGGAGGLAGLCSAVPRGPGTVAGMIDICSMNKAETVNNPKCPLRLFL